MKKILQGMGVLPQAVSLQGINKKDQLDIDLASYRILRDQALQTIAPYLKALYSQCYNVREKGACVVARNISSVCVCLLCRSDCNYTGKT